MKVLMVIMNQVHSTCEKSDLRLLPRHVGRGKYIFRTDFSAILSSIYVHFP